MENNKFKFKSIAKKTSKETEKKTERENFSIEELKKYYTEFMCTYNSNIILIYVEITEEIKRLNNILDNPEENIKTDQLAKASILEEINSSIKILKDDYIINASFLSSYDKHNYSSLLEDVSDSSNKLKEKINPRKKFAFTANKKTNTEIVSRISESSEDNARANTKIELEINLYDFIVKDKHDLNNKLVISKEEIYEKNNLIIENISNCEIIILHSFKACYMKNVSNTILYIGSVGGGTHITNCKDSCLYLTTHQLRIHQTHKTKFNIIANSNPIIEDCSELKFYPLKLNYLTYEENLENAKIDKSKNKWNAVLDFKWHKKEKSPNFEVDDTNQEINLEI